MSFFYDFRELIGPGSYDDSINSDKSLPSFLITPENPSKPQSPASSDIGSICCTDPTSSDFNTSDWVSSSSSCKSSPVLSESTQENVLNLKKACQSKSARVKKYHQTSASKRGYFTGTTLIENDTNKRPVFQSKCLEHDHTKSGMYIPMTEPITPEDDYEVVPFFYPQLNHNNEIVYIPRTEVFSPEFYQKNNNNSGVESLPQKQPDSKNIISYIYPGTNTAYTSLIFQENNNNASSDLSFKEDEACTNNNDNIQTTNNSHVFATISEEPYSPSGSIIDIDYIPSPVCPAPTTGPPSSPINSPSNIIIGSRVNLLKDVFIDDNYESSWKDFQEAHVTSTPIKWK